MPKIPKSIRERFDFHMSDSLPGMTPLRMSSRVSWPSDLLMMEGQLTMKTSLTLCTPTLESLKQGIGFLTIPAEVGI
jgi:hypothetical protein